MMPPRLRSIEWQEMLPWLEDSFVLEVALLVEHRGLMAGAKLVRARCRWALDLEIAAKVAQWCVQRCGGK